LKPPSGAARAEIIPAEFFHEFFLAVDDLQSALHFGFGWITLPALTTALESGVVRSSIRFA
jgi:hypothetical protein